MIAIRACGWATVAGAQISSGGTAEASSSCTTVRRIARSSSA